MAFTAFPIPTQVFDPDAQDEKIEGLAGLIKVTSSSVTSRPPNYADGGIYVAGDLWQYDGMLWESTAAVDTDKNLWTAVRSSDVIVPSGVVGVWWMAKLVPEYSGPCLRLRNEATNDEIDIGFDRNGHADWQAALRFGTGAALRVVSVYDQSSAAHHLTTASAAAQPVFEPWPDETGMPRIVFENGVIYNGVAPTPQILDIPAAVTASSSNVFISTMVKVGSSRRDSPMVQLTGATNTELGKRRQTGAECVTAYSNNSAFPLTGAIPSIGPEIISYAVSHTARRARCGHLFRDGTAVTTVALAGGKIGAASRFMNGAGDPLYGGFSTYGVMVATGVTMDGELSIYRAMVRDFNLIPQVRSVMVFDGDSITEGAFAKAYRSWPYVYSSEFAFSGFNPYNVATSGGTSTTQLSGIQQWLSSLQNAPGRRVVTLAIGSNDFAGDVTADAVLVNVNAYISAVKDVGFDVIIATVLPRNNLGTGSKEAARLEYNENIRTGWESMGCIAMLDFANHPVMGASGAVTNTALYVDGTHPTPYGLSLLASYAENTLNPIMVELAR